jgi:hypothetical protein
MPLVQKLTLALVASGWLCCGHGGDAIGNPGVDSGVGSDTGSGAEIGAEDGEGDGPSDGGADGDSGEAGTPVACPGPFVLCEDFENGINGATWTQQGSLAIDTSRAHRGTHSILFSADNALLRTTKPFPQLANDLWARVFVYMDQTPPGSTTSQQGPNASFSWAAGNAGDTRVGFRHTRYSGGYNYPGDDFTNTDDLVWPLNQWVCVEWHYNSDPASGMGTQDYWMDGAPRPMMSFAAHPMPAFTYFWIGMYLFGTLDGGAAYTMWMDDLVLDTKQVGCTQ